MGRRKRKGNPGKRSLLFEESPVTDSGLSAWSPILCVDNPVTAVAIPIDSDCSVPWVSPQFEGIAVSGGKRRQARRGPNKKNVLGDRTAKENSSASSRFGNRRKFPALQFVGDSGNSGKKPVLKAKGRGEKTSKRLKNGGDSQLVGKRAVAAREGGAGSESEGDAENVCQADRDVSCAGGDGGDDYGCADGDGGDDYGCADGDGGDDYGCAGGDGGDDYGCAETVRRRASCRQSVGLRHRPSLARTSVYRARMSELPVHISPFSSSFAEEANKSRRSSARVYCAEQPERNVRSGSNGDDDLCENPDGKPGDGKERYNSDILLSPADVSSMSESRRSVLLGVGALPLRAALFASPSEDASNSMTGTGRNPPPQQTPLNHPRTSNASPRARLPGTRTGRGKEERRLPSMEPAALRQNEKPRRSERLKHKREEAINCLRQRTPQQRRSSGRILVSDTPECQYSLTFKQRQRLRMKEKYL